MKKLNWKWILGFTCLLSFVITGTSSDTPGIIYWSEGYKLTWEDFEGKPKFDYSNRNVSALTTSGLVHYRGCEDGNIIYRIRPYFEKKDSWVKDEARTEYHLAHEQLHFDVTELYARKLRKLLDKRNFKCGEEEEFERFINSYLNNWETAQQAYDFSTHHSMDKEKQQEWHHRINFEMSLLKEFESK